MRFAGLGTALAVAIAAAAPADAQFFLKSKDLSGAPVTGDEAGIGQPLPGATPAEIRAGLAWNLRAALNVAALQCQFEPTLLTVSNYNAILTDHKDELKATIETLGKYFKRVSKTPKEGQNALDQYGTRTYSSFATVSAQYNFCQTAGAIGRELLFQPRGTFTQVAQQRMREVRNSLAPYGDQSFPLMYHGLVSLPRMDQVCWSKKGDWVARKCGVQNWPPASVPAATPMTTAAPQAATVPVAAVTPSTVVATR